jgi:hypothetical protein
MEGEEIVLLLYLRTEEVGIIITLIKEEIFEDQILLQAEE